MSAIISKSSNFSFPLSNSIKSKESDFKSTQSNRFGFSHKKAPNLVGMGLLLWSCGNNAHIDHPKTV
jgi:hypothetical protein